LRVLARTGLILRPVPDPALGLPKMDFRFVIGSLFAISLPLAAQQGIPNPLVPVPAAPPATQPPAAQDPDNPQNSPQAQLERLQKEQERLQKEIAYAKGRNQSAKGMLREKFAAKKPTWRAIDAGVNTPPPMPVTNAAPPKPARVATAEQLEAQPEGTLMIVNGRPVPQASFTQLMAYLGSSPAGGDENMRTQMALFELVRLEAVASMVEENEALEKAAEVAAQLEGGAKIGDLVKSMAVVPGSSPEGRFEVTRGSIFGPVFEMNAFNTEPGKRTRPFRTAHGIALLQVDSREKGASPELDKVIGTAVMAAYSATPEELQKAQMAVNSMQIDVLVRDQKTFDSLPQMWKPAPPAPAVRAAELLDANPAGQVGGPAGGRAQAMLDDLAKRIAELEGMDDDASQAMLKQMKERYEMVKKTMLEQVPTEVVPVPAPGAGEPKKDEPKKEEPKKQG
jgi:hypothetical protein